MDQACVGVPLAYVPERLVRVHRRPEGLSTWRLAGHDADTLPMIERHPGFLRDRLGGFEARQIAKPSAAPIAIAPTARIMNQPKEVRTFAFFARPNAGMVKAGQ